jgi:hypothetical protein
MPTQFPVEPSPWRRAMIAFGWGHTLCFILLLVWIVFCATWLATADSPWDGAITKRIGAGKKPTDDQLTSIALWWGAAANVAGAIWLVVSFQWWGKKNESRPSSSDERKRLPWGFIGILVGIAAFAGFLWLPRLSHSLTSDEEMAFRNYVSGKWTEDEGTRRFEPVDWRRTIVQNRESNYTLQTVASRACNEIWRSVNNKGSIRVSQRELRPFQGRDGSPATR